MLPSGITIICYIVSGFFACRSEYIRQLKILVEKKKVNCRWNYKTIYFNLLLPTKIENVITNATIRLGRFKNRIAVLNSTRS